VLTEAGIDGLTRKEAKEELRARSLGVTDGGSPLEEVKRAVVFDLYAERSTEWTPAPDEVLQTEFVYVSRKSFIPPLALLPVSNSSRSVLPATPSSAACTDAPAGNCVPESSTVLLDIAKEHAAAQEREKQRKERLERCEARGLRVAARRGARQDYRELCRLDNFADSGPEDLDSE